jgi:hypothetical protein
VSAADVNADVLEHLRRGDEVFVAEKLKECSETLATTLDKMRGLGFGSNPAYGMDEILEPADDQAEEFLAIVFPALEYGSSYVIDLLPRALVHIARPTPLADRPKGSAFATLAVGRLAWAIAAFCVHTRRFDGLAALWSATRPPREGDFEAPSLLADPLLRVSDVFGTQGGPAFEDYRRWLEERPLIERYPLFAAELDDVFAEADFLLALRVAAARPKNVSSVGFTAKSVASFRGRLADPKQAAGVAQLFAATQGALKETLEAAYARLLSDPDAIEQPPEQLFPEKAAA